jgi:hypothetical protein
MQRRHPGGIKRVDVDPSTSDQEIKQWLDDFIVVPQKQCSPQDTDSIRPGLSYIGPELEKRLHDLRLRRVDSAEQWCGPCGNTARLEREFGLDSPPERSESAESDRPDTEVLAGVERVGGVVAVERCGLQSVGVEMRV